MEKGQFVKNIGPADAVEGLFLLEEASLQQAKNGPFWRLSLRDATGAASAKIWSPLSQEFPALEAGCLVRVQAVAIGDGSWGSPALPFANSFSATGLLIVVSVALEINKQLESQIMMKHYKGFLK